MKYLLLSIILFTSFNTGNNIPTSQRARNAINNQLPFLQQEFSDKGFSLGNNVFLRIFKESKELEVWVQKGNRFELFKTYIICYYSGTLGSKTRVGDSQAPEGFYFVRPSQLNPNSSFHLSFNIGYPNAYDRAHNFTGSAIMVHGSCVSIGCFAMTDGGIEEIYTIVNKAFEGGQPFFRIHVFPFRMSAERMLEAKESTWYDFWQNLKEGYDIFEENRVPPNVTVANKKYRFN